MKRILFFAYFSVSIFGAGVMYSQTDHTALKQIIKNLYEEVKKNPMLRGFDVEKNWSIAVSKHTDPKVQLEIFEAAKSRYVQEKLATQYGVSPSGKQPFAYNYDEKSKTGYVDLSPMNVNCANADFENLNFSNWTGGTYTNSAATNWNTFTPAWVNGVMTQGNNVPPQALWPGFVNPYPNRHTIMTIPPTANTPPNCIGWDSIAINPTTHLSDIAFVPPTANGVTCRLGNANNNYNETERLLYTMAVTSQNSQFTISYAVVVYDGGHPTGEQPFFKITTRDQNGNPITGCGQYQVDASQVATDTSFIAASYWNGSGWTDPVTGGFNSYYYKKWTTVGMDLSAYVGQTITVEFRTGDCIWGGHWGYAYVDASCQPAQAVVNMCTGSTTAVLVAPPGYSSYQWYGPNGMTLISGATNDSLNISNALVGDVYTVVLSNVAGCTTSMQTTLTNTNIQVQSTGSTPSCLGGFSGTASVFPTGSNNGYNYAWADSATGNAVGGNSGSINGLSPGTYSVVISSPNCGSDTAVVTVGISPPVYYTDLQNFCMNPAQIVAPSGSNYIWYDPFGSVIPSANTGTLSVNSPVSGSVYTTVFSTPSGCKDSVRITITQTVNQLMDTITYCGSVATLTVMPTGTNVIWYDGNTYAQIGTGNNLNVTNPVPSTWWPSYYGTYTNPTTGCKDSVSVYMTNIPTNIYPTNIVNTCDGISNGAVTLNMNSSTPPTYSVTVTGPTGYTNNSANASETVTGLAPGTYTATINDGQCIASATFIIDTIIVNVTATVAQPNICAGQSAVVNFNYGGGAPTSCGPATSGCNSTTTTTVGSGSSQNANTTWPSVYGNWYSNEKYQILYTASDLLASGITAGKITSIGFDVASIPSGMNTTFINYTIKIGCTSASSLDPTNIQWGVPFVSPVTQTVWGPTNHVVTTGWSTHNFSTPWEWDGMSNIVVEICYDWVGPSNYTYNAIMNSTATSYASFLVYNSDVTVACPQTSANSSYLLRPNTKFTTCQSVAVPSDFTYSWNPNTGVSGTAPTVTITATANTTYTCTVTSNVGGCSIQLPVTINVTSALTTSATSTDILCNGDATGTATITASGGTPGYSATWSNGTTGLNPTNFAAGTYTAVVSDSNNCVDTVSVTITEPSAILVSLASTDISCVSPAGSITSTVSGGTPGYTYSWSPSASGANPTGLAGGTYTLTLADSNNCVVTQTVTIGDNSNPPGANAGQDAILNCGNSTTVLSGSSGSSGVNYSWTGPNGFTSSSQNPSIADTGVYVVTVTNPVNGCTSTDSVAVTQASIDASFISNPASGVAPLTVVYTNTSSGANSYIWDFGNGLGSFNQHDTSLYVIPGTYTVTLIAMNPAYGCFDTTTAIIIVDFPTSILIPNVFTPNGDGKNDIFYIPSTGLTSLEVSIFDRWGMKMIEFNTIDGGWNGKTPAGGDATEGTYFYMVKAVGIDGKEISQQGHLLLTR